MDVCKFEISNPSTCIVDRGVGIFRSVPIRGLKKVAVNLKVKSNASILREILYGQIQSSTGLPYRGKGLPSMLATLRRKGIRRLTIVTNDAFADVENDTFRSLHHQFKGTFVYWEFYGE
jgi:hypothetical protein